VTLICFAHPKINLTHPKSFRRYGYKGEAAITTPHKKPNLGEITESQKQENKELSSSRIGVEHLIGRVKISE
jgi:hypothetical protein